jgi:fructan beta-fructosidase
MMPPAFHHFAPNGWINDPVGLYRRGETWVLHDQRSRGIDDQTIGWGRAVSKDLLHWRDDGMVLPPGDDGWIYSGCVVPRQSDARAFFTLHDPLTGLQAQATSPLKGSGFGTPRAIIPPKPNSRDPFVFSWGGGWRMLLAEPPPWNEPFAHPARLRQLASEDLETWCDVGLLGPPGEPGLLFETPFLRRLPCSGAPAEHWPWLLAVSTVDRRDGSTACGTRAWLGHFDGALFEPTSEPFRLDHGPDFYAPAIWSGTADDELLMTGWTNSWAYARRLPSRGWSGGAHALPRRLSAIHDKEGWSLRQRPARLPEGGEPRVLAPCSHEVGPRFSLTIHGRGALRLGDLELRFGDTEIVLERSCRLGTLAEAGFVGSWSAPRPASALEWVIDGCVAELFAADGSLWLTALTLRGEEDPIMIGQDLAVTLRHIA